MSRQPWFALGVTVLSVGFFYYQLESCSSALESEPPPPPRTDPVPIVAFDDLVEISPLTVSDQLIICKKDRGNGSTVYSFTVWDGAVWRYDSVKNLADRKCPLTDGTCKFGWFGERLALIAKAPTRTYTYLVDLDKLEMDEVVDLNFSNMGLEPSLNPTVPCMSRPKPIGVLKTSAE
ncbi:hypothetical protein [Erythrobacter rubeus]|uniref:Uncharacterized protein n=1 Tax=Erythrobacter rubeus TaxID=2760803 RepID=A0ABR8KP52_9SPHN|nr:hypothetical protein [Erythrobacter rubeus]MBD2842424.1 hypothetical protein [Erythrobacter rubeus]